MTTVKKVAAKKAAVKINSSASGKGGDGVVTPVITVKVSDLEQAIGDTLSLIEKAESLAPAGIVSQHCQLAKVRIQHAAELLEVLKP